ncbi:MAG: protease pro-enzyme activation domain-containing protein [Candidatus Sulfotelmatobacter sp.]
MRPWKFVLPLLATSLCFAAQSDRITAPIDSSQMVKLPGNVHGLAQPRFDIGRTNGGRQMYGVSLVFHPSAAQQQNLNNLLAQQQDRSSPNYHKWLTPAQFADRFGMTKGDISRVVTWLESQGFTVASVSNSRNQVSFDGTVAQVEAAFATEIHDYVVDGETHFANATNPSVPAALAGSVLSIGHLHNFSPKPRAIVRRMSSNGVDSHFTSSITGDHYLSPGDFATVYGLQPLYTAGDNGSGESIAIVGQSTVSATDLSHFRSAAGLPAKTPQYILYPSTSTATRCSGDEGESDLDLEWSGGVASNANIVFVYAGLVGTDTCANRSNSVWDALQHAVDSNVAPVISTSYGYCESGLGQSFVDTVQGWAQQANSQGQTIMAASGDDGAADCDGDVSSATHGLAVDVPASIPEVTGMGGTEFDGDGAGAVSGGNASATSYWSGTTGGTDTISSALSYIPEMAWNDTAEDNTLSASGGGASIYFTKPTWQTGTGVPSDGKRDVPDLALNTSPDHDGYLFCSEDGPNGAIATTCTSGFRDGSGGDLAVVGGTSAAAPTFSAIVAILNEYLGTSGLGGINSTLYSLAANTPSAFHDVTTGNNIVPCTSGTTGCPTTGTPEYGFSAGVGYDQVTGLGSVDANALAVAWKATLDPDFQLSAGALSPIPVSAGQSTTTTLTIAPVSGSSAMTVNFAPSNCTGLPTGASCSFNPTSVYFDGTSAPPVTLTISTLANTPLGTETVTITPTNSPSTTATVSLTVTATNQTFAIAVSNNTATFSVAAGATASVPITVTGTNGFILTSPPNTTALAITYTCLQSSIPSEVTPVFSPGEGNSISNTSLTLSLYTTAPTSQLRPLLGPSNRIFYALLLPGLFGIVLASGSPGRRGVRLLSLIVVLGFSTMWLGSCSSSGGSNGGQSNPGTPAGTYSIVVNATTAGPNALTATPLKINLVVTN